MIDGLKLKITNKDCIHSVINNSKLNFKISVSERTGEIHNPTRQTRYKNLLIKYKNTKEIFISGNLYSYFYDIPNYKNFPIIDALTALKELEQDLNIDLTKTEIMRLEWG